MVMVMEAEKLGVEWEGDGRGTEVSLHNFEARSCKVTLPEPSVLKSHLRVHSYWLGGNRGSSHALGYLPVS